MSEEIQKQPENAQGAEPTLEENMASQALVLQSQLKEIVVNDDMSFKKAASIEATAKANIKALTAHLEVQIDDAFAKHKKLTTKRNELLTPHQTVAKDARQKCIVYSQEQERVAKEKARKAEEEAQELALEEQRKEAAAAAKAGDSKAAMDIMEAPVSAPIAPAPVKEVLKVKGARKVWSAKITDAKKLFKAWGTDAAVMPELDQDQLESLCTVLKLHEMARGMKKNTGTFLPGVEGVCKTV